MGLGRDLLHEYLRHRLLGGRHRPHGRPMMSRRYADPFRLPRRRAHRHVEVRGCGCCLPIPLGLVVGTAAGIGLLANRGTS